MPTYDYRCPQCGKFTVSQGIKEKALAVCPSCGSPVERLIGKNVNIIYKCSGFYCTDTHSASGNWGKKNEEKTTCEETGVKNETAKEGSGNQAKAVNE